jgi:sodium-dependent phosphate transporter
VISDDPDTHCHCACLCLSCFPAVGGIIGFALVFGGGDAVVWYAPAKDFPYIAGIAPVVISWFLSPLLAALITLILFLIVRTLVLRRAASTKIAFWVLPVLVFLTFFINLFFILVSPQLCTRTVRSGTCAALRWTSAVVSSHAACICLGIAYPVLKHH